MNSQGTVPMEARNLCFSFSRPIVRNISFSLRAGVITGIIGPNGSGKTTLLRLLDGILRPLSGEVVLNGHTSITRLSRRKIAQQIAMVPQNGTLYQDQSVFNFAIQGRSPHLSILGFESFRDEQITSEALEMTQLTHLRDALLTEISGGEKQRVLLSRALVQRPEILLLDEFTANLDINYQVELMRLVQRVTRQNNLATLIVSHEINLLAAFAEHVVLLNAGKVFRQGTVMDVITPDNLKTLFGLDFAVRSLPGESLEVRPIMNKGN